jgi:hypothetical protein
LNQPTPTDALPVGWGYKPTLTGMKKSFKDQFKERLKKCRAGLKDKVQKDFRLD